MNAETWRAAVLTVAVLVGCTTLLRICGQVNRIDASNAPTTREMRDPDTICYERCLGPWVSYTRGSDGQDHCVCTKSR